MIGVGLTQDDLLAKLQRVKPTGNGYTALCPGHDDSASSLSITTGNQGRILLHCFAGCPSDQIVASLGLTLADLFPPREIPAARRIVTEYLYQDERKALLYVNVRYTPKDFNCKRLNAAGVWVWNLGGGKSPDRPVRRVLYRLPEIRNRRTIYYVEGEADADTLWALDLPATTHIGGAQSWRPIYLEQLRAAQVERLILLPDHDVKGLAMSTTIAIAASRAGLTCKLVRFPDVPITEKHGLDVRDWLQRHTKTDLAALVTSTPIYVPESPDDAPSAAEPPETTDPITDDPLAAGGFHRTDHGAAEYFTLRYQDRVRYDHQRKQWFVWSGQHWQADAVEQMYQLGREHARHWQQAVHAITDLDERQQVFRFASQLERRAPTENMLHFVKSYPPIAQPGGHWDLDPWLLGVPNGVLDLRTGTLRDGEPVDHVTLQTSPAYDPSAQCPRWLQFLSEVFDEDTDLMAYIQRACGYALTGDMREQCFFLAYGSGANGKSVYLDTLQAVWGGYGHRVSMRVFATVGAEESRFDLASLRSGRLIVASEIKTHSRMNEHVLKNFTGGETMTAERKYQDEFTFRPVGKIWLAVNHRPKVSDDSFGFWRRVRLIPFERTFAGSQDDPTLRATLAGEAAGILAWAVRGCLTWQREGLRAPASVLAATDEYEQAEDPLRDFYTECIQIDTNSSTSGRTAYQVYRQWAEDAKLRERDILGANAFGAKLAARFQQKRTAQGVWYQGITVSRPHSSLFANS